MNPKVQVATLNALLAIAGQHGDAIEQADKVFGQVVKKLNELEARLAKLEVAKPAEPADDA